MIFFYTCAYVYYKYIVYSTYILNTILEYSNKSKLILFYNIVLFRLIYKDLLCKLITPKFCINFIRFTLFKKIYYSW